MMTTNDVKPFLGKRVTCQTNDGGDIAGRLVAFASQPVVMIERGDGKAVLYPIERLHSIYLPVSVEGNDARTKLLNALGNAHMDWRKTKPGTRARKVAEDLLDQLSDQLDELDARA